MIRVVQIAVPHKAHRWVPAHDDIRLAVADNTRQVSPQAQRRLDRAVLIAQEYNVLDAENTRRFEALTLADRHQSFVGVRVLVRAGASARHETKDDFASLLDPLSDRACDAEL